MYNTVKRKNNSMLTMSRMYKTVKRNNSMLIMMSIIYNTVEKGLQHVGDDEQDV